MAFLKVNVIEGDQVVEREFEAKTNFQFERLANKKYGELSGEKIGGFMSIYLGILEYDPLSLSAFWDCALQHYKNRPTLNQIEEALLQRIEENDEAPFKEVFKVLDESGFFRKRVKDIWKELEKSPKPKDDETDEERKERMKQEEATKMMKKRRKELTA